MDIDPPVFIQVNRAYIKANKAYTDDDKKTHCTYGRCFNCSKQGHMAKDCLLKRKQQFLQSSYKSSHSNWHTTPQSVPCKYNQPRQQKRTFQMPQRFGQLSQSFARTATIKEVQESDDEDEEDISSLATHIAKFSDRQCKQWVEEMKALGINF
jgi:hypothetical protein